MQWLAITLHTTSEHGVSSITTADAAHLGCQQSTELTPTGRFKWTGPFRAEDEIWFLRMCRHIFRSSLHPVEQAILSNILCDKQNTSGSKRKPRLYVYSPRVSLPYYSIILFKLLLKRREKSNIFLFKCTLR